MYMFQVNTSSRLNELFFFLSFAFIQTKTTMIWLRFVTQKSCKTCLKIIEPIFIMWIVINRCKIGDWMKKFYFHFSSLFNNGQ